MSNFNPQINEPLKDRTCSEKDLSNGYETNRLADIIRPNQMLDEKDLIHQQLVIQLKVELNVNNY